MSKYRIAYEATLLRDLSGSWVVRIGSADVLVPKKVSYFEDGTLYVDEDYPPAAQWDAKARKEST